MNREEFRISLKKRMLFLRIFTAVYFLVFAAINHIDLFAASTPQNDFLKGFISGLSVFMLIFLVVVNVKATKALSNEENFEKIYIAQTDERSRYIKEKCGVGVVMPLSVILICVGMIAGYFSFPVFVALVAAGNFQIIVCCVLKLYYSKKY